MLTERFNNITRLQEEINKQHKSNLTFEQVDHWVGSDTSLTSIIDTYYEVKISEGKEGVTPDDVLSLWADMKENEQVAEAKEVAQEVYDTDRLDFLAEDKSLLETPEKLRFDLAIFLFSYTLKKYKENGNYMGSNDDINIMNFACDLASSLVGFDVAEEDSWTQYTGRATADEIALFAIDKLFIAFPALVPVHKKLFALAFEAGDLTETLLGLIVSKDSHFFSLISQEQTSLDSGWSEEEVETIDQLEIFGSVDNYSHSQNTLIRIR
jgi:hypothetical protein